jgi:hypothetical protein
MFSKIYGFRGRIFETNVNIFEKPNRDFHKIFLKRQFTSFGYFSDVPSYKERQASGKKLLGFGKYSFAISSIKVIAKVGKLISKKFFQTIKETFFC